jgi:hypothetical protein
MLAKQYNIFPYDRQSRRNNPLFDLISPGFDEIAHDVVHTAQAHERSDEFKAMSKKAGNTHCSLLSTHCFFWAGCRH